MQKRKLKINVLDIAIFVIIICSVCVIIFRDQIHELVDPTEIINIEVSVRIDDAEFDMSLLEKSASVRFDPDAGTSAISDGHVISVPQHGAESEDDRSVTFVCTGYKRLGLLYTENGDRIKTERQCVLTVGGTSVNAVLTQASVRQAS